MAWIRVIPPQQAEGKLVDYYARVRDASGSVDNILTIHSLRPESLRTHYELYRDLMYGPSELTRAQREMVAVAVSAANQCHY